MAVIGIQSTISASSLVLDLGSIVSRVAKLLRRSDLDSEIVQWVNFAQRELCDQVNFPELRFSAYTTLTPAGVQPWSIDLPGDYMREDRVYYLDNTVTPSWGRELKPVPRRVFAEYVERLVNVSNPPTGDPTAYFIDGTHIYLYPSPNKAARLELTYYLLPTDMTANGNLPSINSRYRHYLIYLAYYWGMIFLEKEDPNKVLMWERRKTETIKQVRKIVNRVENRNEYITIPPTGTERATDIY